MTNRKRFICLLTLALFCLALLAGCGSSGRKWSDSDVIDDYGTITQNGKETDVCVCHDQENVYFYTDDDKHKFVDSAALPTDELYEEDWTVDLVFFDDLDEDGNSDLEVYLSHEDLSESYIVLLWEKGKGYVYQPEYSFFYEPTVFYDDDYDFSDFEGVWLADEDNLYEDCYIEFDWDGSWYLNVAEETIDQGYLLYDSVWDCIYVECLWDTAIADGEVILDGDLLYIDTLGYFEHLVSEDETDEYDEYYSWNPDLCQRNVSEFEGVWYCDGDPSIGVYIIIDGYGNWSYYECADGETEGAEMDYGTFSYSEDEISTYYANSELYDDLSFCVYELDADTILWGETTFCRME